MLDSVELFGGPCDGAAVPNRGESAIAVSIAPWPRPLKALMDLASEQGVVFRAYKDGALCCRPGPDYLPKDLARGLRRHRTAIWKHFRGSRLAVYQVREHRGQFAGYYSD